MAGDWRSKVAVAVVVTVIGCGLYPSVVVPLQIAYGGRERPERDPSLQPGFTKKSMWKEIESSAQPADKEGGKA
ncbi:hypothetical protein Rsub_08633 [Raphidocelis subcapitata]|uniref:Uncharacterized protein n=1 Tax=Raphidocelis subcapitata TaxID=307507 RepID=A0A2V0P703_9CHLO|nr:hypothetical protein Rsub_08633 [Raphidocelis subcapitata]|eukprot:GBF95651.1 hypothetical protein Rsub_08633 [Raphidocelis subcapitata]